MNKESKQTREPIVLLIDGYCNLCHGVTRFVIKRDSARRFRFASIQSPVGQHHLVQAGLSLVDLDTFVMVQNHHYYTKSDAALRVFRQLGSLWPLLYGFIIIPVPIRNWVYDQIAHRRYRWFGRRETCLLPTDELRGLFIEDIDEVNRCES